MTLHALASFFLGQLEAPIYERLLDYGAIGILTIVGWTLFFRSEAKREAERKERDALQTKLELEAKEYAKDMRDLAVSAHTSAERTADGLESAGKGIDVMAVELRRTNDARGLPR